MINSFFGAEFNAHDFSKDLKCSHTFFYNHKSCLQLWKRNVEGTWRTSITTGLFWWWCMKRKASFHPRGSCFGRISEFAHVLILVTHLQEAAEFGGSRKNKINEKFLITRQGYDGIGITRQGYDLPENDHNAEVLTGPPGDRNPFFLPSCT